MLFCFGFCFNKIPYKIQKHHNKIYNHSIERRCWINLLPLLLLFTQKFHCTYANKTFKCVSKSRSIVLRIDQINDSSVFAIHQ